MIADGTSKRAEGRGHLRLNSEWWCKGYLVDGATLAQELILFIESMLETGQ